MAITYAQTTKWSAIVELVAQEKSIIANVASGIYQADASNAKVIRAVSVGTPTISAYDPSATMSYSDLTDTTLDITMDKKFKYNFKIDDIDAMQSVPDLENPALIEAGMGLALEADKAAFALWASATTLIESATPGTPETVTAANIDTLIGQAMETLDGFNAGPERVLVVNPHVFKFIVDDARTTLTNNVDVFKSGVITDYYGFTVYKSNSLTADAGTAAARYCIAMTKRALPFAASVVESENFRLQSSFATAHRGLFVFGVGVKFADEMVALNLV